MSPFPYISFGRTSIYDWSTGPKHGSEQLLTLHVWSKAKGKTETLEIMEAARARCTMPALPLEGHQLVNMRHEFAEARFDDDHSVVSRAAAVSRGGGARRGRRSTHSTARYSPSVETLLHL